MDALTQVRLTRALVDIDSTTGREHEAGAFLASTLRGLGYDVVEQPVAAGRCNLIATNGKPVVVLSTHFDCVPPFFPSREANGRIHGRGACDAKGAIAAQIAAAERLRTRGETRVGLLYVVGEERGSDGAQVANDIAPGSTFLIDGEPTDNRLAVATRGIYRVRVNAIGRAAHSSQPHLGESAIDRLIDALVALRSADWPADPQLGNTSYSIGLIEGGVAPNVISPTAAAEIVFRSVGDFEALKAILLDRLGGLATVEDILVVPPVRLKTMPGIDTAVFWYATDVPFLSRWGTPLLVGPGSVEVAHTSDEFVEIEDLLRASDLYEQLATRLLAH